MNLKSKVRVQSWSVPKTKIPYCGKEQEKKLNKWQSPYNTLSSREILEKVLTIVGNYRFLFYDMDLDKNSDCFFKPLILRTTDGRTIRLGLGYGGSEDPDTLNITENGMEDVYNVFYNSGELIVEPSKTIELSTGFEQYYYNDADYFSKLDGNIRTFVKISLPKNEKKYVFIDEEIKKEFKETKFNNIIDVYNFLVNRISGISDTFNISTYNNKSWSSLEKIKVEKGKIKELELRRNVNGNEVRIYEKFSSDEENEALEELIGQVRSLYKK